MEVKRWVFTHEIMQKVADNGKLDKLAGSPSTGRKINVN
jgi:hypothetical protein